TVTAKTNLLGVFGLMQDARPQPVYSDTSFNWAKDIISDMAAKKIVNGYPDGRFLPNKGITRGEFVTLLANTLGWAAETTDVRFDDAIPAWAQGSVAAAVNRGVVKGYADGTFQPNRVVNRAEMAVMLDIALSLPKSGQPSNYGDAGSIPAWAVQAIRDTKVTGIMLGSGNRFRPKDVANRAEATAVMAKALMYYVQS
ncbi:MAG: S-layer homology domain-containing protein, partial [Eubacteriales bacterium]